jgi:hypothetical protein
MSGNREPIFQLDPACPMRNGVITTPARGFRTPDLENDARGAVCGHSLLDRRMPVRATEPAFGHLPPWAQPVWTQRLPL